MDIPTGALVASPEQWAVYDSLELIAELYNYSHWIFSRIRPFIHGELCEVGCGIGNITQFLLNQQRVVGIEPEAEFAQLARRRFADHRNVVIERFTLEQCPNDKVAAESFDTVICINVLEHIEQDVEALGRMKQLVRPGGRVVIFVPAHMSLYGSLDRALGHCRRYSRRSLARVFSQAGLSVGRSFYMNAVGCFGWLWSGRILRRQRIGAMAAQGFEKLVPFVDAFERIIRPPFGQSLVMTGSVT